MSQVILHICQWIPSNPSVESNKRNILGSIASELADR